jgi:hypothetical protein
MQTAIDFAAKEELYFEEASAKTGLNVEKAIASYAWEIARKQVDIIDPKDLYLHFLLELNEDFDDDLLQEALELLVDL